MFGERKTLLNVVRKPELFVPADLNVSVSHVNDLVDLEKEEIEEEEEDKVLMRALFGKGI